MNEPLFFCLALLASLQIQHITALLVEAIQPCLFEINSTSKQEGEIYSPNYPSPYPNNLNCRYEFYGSENELIILEPEDFQLEAPNGVTNQDINFMDFVETRGKNNDPQPKETTPHNYFERQCFYDFLDVFTTNVYGTIIWHSRHCGSTIQKRIVSTSPTLFLVFQTDRMLAYKGFKFRYSFSNLDIFPLTTQIKHCGSSSITGNGGVLSSPHYPQKYPANTDCAWTITVQPHQTILIKFIDVNFEEACKLTFVNIWDGYVSNVDHPDMSVCDQLKFYHKGFKEFNSKSNRVVIKFETEKKRNLEKRQTWPKEMQHLFGNKTSLKIGGFSLIWTAVSLKTECDGFRCKGGKYCIDSTDKLCHTTNEYCISQSLQCDGVFNCDYKDESDEHYCGLQNISSELRFVTITIVVIFVLISVICCFVHRRKTRLLNSQSKQEQEAKLKVDYIDQPHCSVFSNTDTIISDENKIPSKMYDCIDVDRRSISKEKSVTTFKASKSSDTNVFENFNSNNTKTSKRNSLRATELECIVNEKKAERKRSKDKIYTSISQHDMAHTDYDEYIESSDRNDNKNLDSKSIIARRNSYTLAIDDKD